MTLVVEVNKSALKALKKFPRHVTLKLQLWVEHIKHQGLEETRKIKGFHDEPLKGKRAGQRSIRLSKQYRAVYEVKKQWEIKLIEVVEVNKHDY